MAAYRKFDFLSRIGWVASRAPLAVRAKIAEMISAGTLRLSRRTHLNITLPGFLAGAI